MNENFIKNVKGIIDETMKPYRELQQEINNSNLSELNNEIKRFNEPLKEISKQLVEISKLWTDYYATTTSPLINTLKTIDFSKIEEQTRNACEIMLENGFYPYSKMGLSICAIVNCKGKDNIENELSQNVEIDLKNNKKRFERIFKNYKEIIAEIYELYDSKKYRLCILSQINFISQVFNSNFEYKDFTESKEDNLRDVGILTDLNKEYYQFIPYRIDEDSINNKKIKRKYKNTILANYRNNPEKYEDVPYNRNAILHGYSKKFGTKINCLRWFSVMLNTLDLFELYTKLDEVR